MRRALLVGSATRLKPLAGLLAHRNFEIEPAPHSALAELGALTKREHYDVMLVDLEAPQVSGFDFVMQLKHRGGVPVMLVGSTKVFKRHEHSLEVLVAQPDIDCIARQVGDFEFGWRLDKVAPRVSSGLTKWTVPELRSEKTGRLDASRVAAHFGWSLTVLSSAFRRSVQSVHKTPDAPALQKRLEPLERVAVLAKRLVSVEQPALLKWLNTPSPDLDGEKPRELLLQKPAVVLEWLEDAAVGQPA